MSNRWMPIKKNSFVPISHPHYIPSPWVTILIFFIWILSICMCPFKHVDEFCVHTNSGCACVLVLHYWHYAVDIILFALGTILKICLCYWAYILTSSNCSIVFWREHLLHFIFSMCWTPRLQSLFKWTPYFQAISCTLCILNPSYMKLITLVWK